MKLSPTLPIAYLVKIKVSLLPSTSCTIPLLFPEDSIKHEHTYSAPTTKLSITNETCAQLSVESPDTVYLPSSNV